MPYRVYDYRTDIRNLEIQPEIRTRFIRLAPGEVHARHSHDLGHEVFLILQGQADIEIAGERAILSPGQLCIVAANQMHQVRNAGDGPLVLYLSVTPHIEPTHTMWSSEGDKLPPQYGGATRDVVAPSTTPLSELAGRQAAALRQLAGTVQAAVAEHERLLPQIAGTADKGAASKATVDALWAAIFPLFRDVALLGATWNELAAAAGSSDH
jgi:quercetin dioxygenase-like cupin family protein